MRQTTQKVHLDGQLQQQEAEPGYGRVDPDVAVDFGRRGLGAIGLHRVDGPGDCLQISRGAHPERRAATDLGDAAQGGGINGVGVVGNRFQIVLAEGDGVNANAEIARKAGDIGGL